jgi:dCMP deaminase
MESWNKYFADMAEFVSKRSTDTSTKVGAVIVGPDKEVRSTGYNGLPRGTKDSEERLSRPAKYLWTEHAERNAIYNAARVGTSTKGCSLYVQLHPCVDCARAIIQSGIIEVHCPPIDETNPRWNESMNVSKEMMLEAGINLVYDMEQSQVNV